MHQEKSHEEIESYRKAIKVNPGFTEAHYNLGNALKEKGDIENAIGSYRKANGIRDGDRERSIWQLR